VTERVARAAARALARRTSRRGFLAKVAVVGSAIAVAPIRYLVRPVSAEAVIRCANCAAGRTCCDGWTSFCCTINAGRNQCPANTYMGGWWKCTDYRGHGACAKEGVRYYVDCNRTPGTSCPNGCHCAENTCSNRSTCCNVFRYGQCNTEIAGVTEVVCRVVTCVSPGHLYANCGTTLKVENRVCSHEAHCL
jgi:hypothetical protein